MREVSMDQTEMINGGEGGFWIGAACAGTVILAGAFIYGTTGVGAAIGAHATAVACGGLIGWGMSTGTWF